jgi:hypothetical protein
MTFCDREELVLDILRSGRSLADTDLAPHVAACAQCADLADVASAVLDDLHVATHDSPVPTSGVVWWRMQRRAQQEAMKKATRTVTAAQWLSVAAAVIVALSIVGFATLKTLLAGAIQIPDMATLAQWSVPLVLALVACLAVAPVAVYLSFARD